MSPRFDRVWWLKKALPHRRGQRCRREYDERLREREPWVEAGEMLFQFEDGSYEYGPKKGARRPDREFSDRMEHANPDCVGQWRCMHGGWSCPKCDVWVRRSEGNDLQGQQEDVAGWALDAAMKSQDWVALFEFAEKGIAPLHLSAWLRKVVPMLEWDRAFNLAVNDVRARGNTTAGGPNGN